MIPIRLFVSPIRCETDTPARETIMVTIMTKSIKSFAPCAI